MIDLTGPPDSGTVPRDGVVLDLDRAFDRASIVLLHGLAGGGKTTAARDFGDWYLESGGAGLRLFTSFRHHPSLPTVLDQLGQAFGPILAENGVDWRALDPNGRWHLSLSAFRMIPTLWIWDNVESVDATHGDGAWTEDERAALRTLLTTGAGAGCLFLLTTRAASPSWLAPAAEQVAVTALQIPPMIFAESAALVRTRVEASGGALDLDAYPSLIHASFGNPLTLDVLTGHALRTGRATRADVEALVRALRSGEAGVEPEPGCRTPWAPRFTKPSTPCSTRTSVSCCRPSGSTPAGSTP